MSVPTISRAEFLVSAFKPNQYPAHDLPEIAFAGRSNVGKSSLINTLVNRKKLVRTSSTPGRTQSLNFFTVNDRYCFVDLPGYGYAKVPQMVKKNWGPMMETYLRERKNLKGVVLILDARRTPSRDDQDMLRLMGTCGVPVLPVVTKIDKVPRTKRAAALKAIGSALGGDLVLTPFSSTTGEGRVDVWAAVRELVGEESAAGNTVPMGEE